jgi:cell division protein FtsL
MEQASYQYSVPWDLETKNDQPQRSTVVRKVIKSKANNQKKRLGKIGVVAFLYALLLVFLCVKSATIGYQINQLEEDVKVLETANNRLDYEIAQATSLDKVQEVAQGQLHMYKPDGSSTLPVASIVSEPIDNKTLTVASVNLNKEEKSESSLSKLYNSLVQLADNR